MSEHLAQVTWKNDGTPFGTDYNRSHVWRFDSGIEVLASSAPGLFGDPSRVDPEEAFVAAISSCHMLWFLHLAAEAGLTVGRYDDHAAGHMGRDALGVAWVSDVKLHPDIDWLDEPPEQQTIDQLHDESHRRCFIANSVRTNITVVAT